MEILDPSQYPAYEAFVASHPNGSITQSTLWHKAKAAWGHEIVVVRRGGNIVAGVSILVKKIPFINTAMLYSPRGPVMDFADKDALAELKAGIDLAAKKHRAYLYKMDPDVLIDNNGFIESAEQLGFKRFYEPTGFETIQTRFNYRLYLEGRDEAAVLANLTQKTRYNIRVALKHEVEVKIATTSDLDEFMRLMRITGERDGFAIRSKSYFAGMMDALGDSCRLYMAYYNGKAVSGAVTTNFAGKTSYIYGASDNEYRNVMANYLLQWEMIRWAVETQCAVYDFQGVSGDFENTENPLYGLYRFKKGFNGVVDELAGEFDYTYRPLAKKLVELAMSANDILRRIKKRLKK